MCPTSEKQRTGLALLTQSLCCLWKPPSQGEGPGQGIFLAGNCPQSLQVEATDGRALLSAPLLPQLTCPWALSHLAEDWLPSPGPRSPRALCLLHQVLWQVGCRGDCGGAQLPHPTSHSDFSASRTTGPGHWVFHSRALSVFSPWFFIDFVSTYNLLPDLLGTKQELRTTCSR